MIVRILGRGQLEIGDDHLAALNAADEVLADAVASGDEAAFRSALTRLVDELVAVGKPLPADALVPSDFVVPDVDASIDDVRELLGDEGLIPG